jgi:hypothetical protein
MINVMVRQPFAIAIQDPARAATLAFPACLEPTRLPMRFVQPTPILFMKLDCLRVNQIVSSLPEGDQGEDGVDRHHYRLCGDWQCTHGASSNSYDLECPPPPVSVKSNGSIYQSVTYHSAPTIMIPSPASRTKGARSLSDSHEGPVQACLPSMKQI